MCKKFVSLILTVILASCSLCVNSAFASSGNGVNCDFSLDSGYLKYNRVSGVQDQVLVKGQYGKGANDSSLKMYTTGGTYYTDETSIKRDDQYIRFNTGLTEAAENEYIHISFEYLRENLFGSLVASIHFTDSSNNVIYSKNLINHLSDNSTHIQARLLAGAKKFDGYNYSYVETVGTWNKVEVYFFPTSDTVVAFINGAKVNLTLNTAWGGSTYTKGVKNVSALMFKHVVDTKASHNPSAIQIDNVIVEKVSAIPDTASFKKSGETLDFDDNMFIYGNSTFGSYGTLWYNGSADSQAQRFKDYQAARPSVRFLNTRAVSVVGGVYGKPTWDNSLYTNIPLDASPDVNGMWYAPGITDIGLGETAHLTFAIANKATNAYAGVKAKNTVLADSTIAELDIFELSSQTGRIKFFGIETNLEWQSEKWYKVDVLFSVENLATVASCYVNGRKAISDYLLSQDKLKDIGVLYFTDVPGASYYLDDISYGRFTADGIHNPTVGSYLSDTDKTYINNTDKIIAIDSDASVLEYKKLLTQKDYVEFFDADGTKVYGGTFNSTYTAKVSNNFGAGIYYNIGYTSPKLDVGDLVFTKEAGLVTTSAYVGFNIKEDYNSPDEDFPTSGTLILAVYTGGTMESIDMVPYTDLSAGYTITAQLALEDIEGKTVKAFILDSLNSLTPITNYKEYNKDLLINTPSEDSDIPKYFVYENTRVLGYFDFEEDDDWFKEDGNFDTWYLETIPSGNSIEVKSEKSGNRYLSLDSLPTTSNTMHISFGVGSGQRIIEFDICSPTKTSCVATGHDASGSRSSIFHLNYDGKMYSADGIYLGESKQDDWTRVAIAVDTNKRTLNYYINGTLKAINVSMPTSIESINALRLSCARSRVNNTVMLDNIIVYSGITLHDFSDMFKGNVDETAVAYDHNIKGVEEFLSYYHAIHTDTGKIYINSLDTVSAMPYYQYGELMVTLNDAQKLVLGSSSSNSNEFVSLNDFASENGKVVTYTKTGTVFVGDREPQLDVESLKTINGYLTYDRPDASKLINSFNSAHPRAMFSPSKLDEVMAEYGNNKYITKWVDDIIERANYFARTGVRPFVPPENNGRLLPTARNTEEELQKLALAYYFTGKKEQKYLDAAWAEIENACNYPHWHQQINDLDSAIMASVIAYGYDWFYGEWTPEQRKVMEDAVWKNQLQYAYEAYHGYRYYAWATAKTNWNAITNGYTALAACVFFETNPNKCADIIENSIRNCEYALNEFYPNGAWGEGPSYWHNTVAPYGSLIYTLKNTFGSYFNLHNAPGLSQTPYYMIGASGPCGVNNFNDSGLIKYATTPNMFWVSDVCGIPEYTTARLKEMDSGVAKGDVYDICYYNPKMKTDDVEIPLDLYFENLELVSMRSEHNNPEATYVSFHSGEGLTCGHSQIDSGTFVIDMLGERFAHDIGSHDYYATGWGHLVNTQPIGSELTRWDYYQNIPQGHNTLVINPKDEDIGQNIISNDKVKCLVSDNSGAYSITELSSAYKGYAKSVQRGIMLGDNRESVLIRDEIKLNSGDNEIYWFMHMNMATEVEFEDDNTLKLIQNEKEVRLRFITDADTSNMYISPCSTVNFTLSPEQEPVTGYKKLVIKLTAKDSVYLAVKLAPYLSDGAWEPIENNCLDNWSRQLVK